MFRAHMTAPEVKGSLRSELPQSPERTLAEAVSGARSPRKQDDRPPQITTSHNNQNHLVRDVFELPSILHHTFLTYILLK